MRRPSPEVVKTMAQVRRQFPELYEWLVEWYRSELEQLPNVGQNVTLAQGRCQVLKELSEILQKSPDYAAQSK